MRVSFLALTAGAVLASLPTASDAQRADNDIFPRSVALQQEGQAAALGLRQVRAQPLVALRQRLRVRIVA